MLLEVLVNKYDMSVGEGGGGRDKKVSIKGVLVKIPGPMKNREGMDTMSMVVLIIGRTCSGLAGPLGS